MTLDPGKTRKVKLMFEYDPEVVTGRKTRFEYFTKRETVIAGAVITVEDKQRVSSGQVILILEVERNGKLVEDYKTLPLNNQGAFAFNLAEIKLKLAYVKGYYIPTAGLGDCYSDRLPM